MKKSIFLLLLSSLLISCNSVELPKIQIVNTPPTYILEVNNKIAK